MKILVTGAEGFIGRHVVLALMRRGHKVLAVSRSRTDRTRCAASRLQLNLLDVAAMEQVVATEKPQGLVHLAWDTTHREYWSSTANLHWTAASLSLFEAFARCGGTRLVVGGTSAEYAWGELTDLVETKSPLQPASLYGISKDALRRVLTSWAPTVGMSWAWGRVFCPFGPYEKQARLIPKVIRSLVEGETLPFDSGALVRDFLHVEDLGEAFAALFDSPVQGAVNLASGQGVSIRDIVSLITLSLDCPRSVQFGALPDPDNQPQRIVANVRRLHDEVGWRPAVDLAARIAETCQWWRQQSRAPIAAEKSPAT